jgi:hypothetical protein
VKVLARKIGGRGFTSTVHLAGGLNKLNCEMLLLTTVFTTAHLSHFGNFASDNIKQRTVGHYMIQGSLQINCVTIAAAVYFTKMNIWRWSLAHACVMPTVQTNKYTQYFPLKPRARAVSDIFKK